MPKLEDLIKEYCPNGVEYKPLWSLTAWDKKFNGLDRKMQSKVITYKYYLSAEFDAVERPNGGVYYLSTGISGKDRYTTEELAGDYLAESEVVCIPWGGTPNVKYYKGKFVTGDNRIATSLDTTALDNKYLFYWMQSQIELIGSFYRGSGIKHPSMKSVLELNVPVPPLPVQREIVRILDNFTELTAEFTAELTAELTARKKQYEYYLNSFFESQKDNLVTLESLGTLTRGKRFVHADSTESGVPCIHYGELYTYYGVHADTVKSHIREELRSKMRYAGKGDVIIVGAGENNIDIGVGVAWEGDEDVAVHDACYTLKHSQNSKYISYYLRSNMYHEQIKKYVSEGKICSISATGLGKALIPMPSLEEQAHIVSILERFDALCNDITAGLPAEIEARQKQYKYYRDKLLSFNEITN